MNTGLVSITWHPKTIRIKESRLSKEGKKGSKYSFTPNGSINQLVEGINLYHVRYIDRILSMMPMRKFIMRVEKKGGAAKTTAGIACPHRSFQIVLYNSHIVLHTHPFVPFSPRGPLDFHGPFSPTRFLDPSES